MEKLDVPLMAENLYKALKEFKNDLGFNYPCLSPQHVRFLPEDHRIELALLPMVFYQFGMSKMPIPINQIHNYPSFFQI